MCGCIYWSSISMIMNNEFVHMLISGIIFGILWECGLKNPFVNKYKKDNLR